MVCRIENVFKNACKTSFGLKKPATVEIKKNKIPWFNRNCKKARNEYHKIRKQYNRNKSSENKNLLKATSKEYKNTIKQSVSRFKSKRVYKLKNLKNAKPRDYWKIINFVDKNDDSQPNLGDLYEYFKNINDEQIDEDVESNQLNSSESATLNEEINQPITEQEIISAIKKLKNNKCSGSDNIINEHLKYSCDLLVPIYKKLFNLILDSSIVPTSWTSGNILPIYKNKGNRNSPENYRPITLLSCFGKLFTAILNNRLNDYAEKCELITSCQAGFRKGFSTVDNLFIIQSLIDILKSQKKKLYCAFIDFKQAFDKVWRKAYGFK